VRKTVKAVTIVVLSCAAIELISSLVLFQYYSYEDKDIRPGGSAALFLLSKIAHKVRGEHPEPVLSTDRGPLFDSDDVLGFAMRPGHYRISEKLDNRKHEFDLTIDAHGRRATSYFPVHASKRLIVAGDSFVFGWGVYDEETIPWLLQVRLPDYEVVNLSVNSYSTIQALLQLQSAVPPVRPEDVIVILYHPLTNELNVAKDEVLDNLANGYEVHLGDAARIRQMKVPFGVIDAEGALSIHRIGLACAHSSSTPECARPKFDLNAARQVTERAFDLIMAMRPGRLVIGQVSGTDDDEVIQYLRSHGATIADLRNNNGVPFDEDSIAVDAHDGPFWQAEVYLRLLEIMQQQHVVN
jgi:hypothetical protein